MGVASCRMLSDHRCNAYECDSDYATDLPSLERNTSFIVSRALLSQAELQAADELFCNSVVQCSLSCLNLRGAGVSAHDGYVEVDDEARKGPVMLFTDMRFVDGMVMQKLLQLTRTADDQFCCLQRCPTDNLSEACSFQLQYAEYPKGCHFQQWHLDDYVSDIDQSDIRVLSLILMLSDSFEYGGGDLELKTRGKQGDDGELDMIENDFPNHLVTKLHLERGDAVIFPSKELWHRVTAVTNGLRRTAVFWTLVPLNH